MPTKLEIKSTRDTPYIIFDAENNQFEIKGNSLPENTNNFFEPVLNWIDNYIKSPNKSTHLICDFEYFNSSSAKMIYNIFLELEKIKESGNAIKITWHYTNGDDLIEEKGLEYKSIINVPFELIQK
ncbi:MAG: DUF1987 domain-containing protein [Bacteroidales bacterium]|nr:DUF1987 domain-containing protein [Bacteroidales bacterium]